MKKGSAKKSFKYIVITCFICLCTIALVQTYFQNKNCRVEQGTYFHSTEQYFKRYCLPDKWREYNDYEKSIFLLVSPEVKTINQTGDLLHPDQGASIHVSITLWRPPGEARTDFQKYYNETLLAPLKENQTYLGTIEHPRYEAYQQFSCEDIVCTEVRTLLSGNNFVQIAYSCAECITVDTLKQSLYYKKYNNLVNTLIF